MQSGIDAPTGKPVDANPADVVKGKPYDFSFLTTSSNPVNVSYTTTCGDAAPVDLGIVAVGGTVKFSYDFSKATAPGTCDITVALFDTANGKSGAVVQKINVYPSTSACTKDLAWIPSVAGCNPTSGCNNQELKATVSCSTPAALRLLLLGDGDAAATATSGPSFGVEVDWGDGSPRDTKQQAFDGSASFYTITLAHTYATTGRFTPQAWLLLVGGVHRGPKRGRC
jgi:hypothetical protein